MTEEEYCHQALADLRKSYERNAKPFIDRLMMIQAMKAPRVVLTPDQALEFIDFKASADKT